MPVALFLTFIMIVAMIFFIVPQITKFRATLGINKTLESGTLSFFDGVKLRLLGFKTPILNTLAMVWSFIIAEGDSLGGVAWERIVSHEHATWIAIGLWGVSLWSHFSGLNAAAASTPVLPGLPGALPAPPLPAILRS